jgi:hypothetical protein
MRWLIVVSGALAISAPVFAQVHSRPTRPPVVSAENDIWYRLGEPVVVSGEFYYPAGPTVFFDGDVMVRVGHHYGIPLYADTTLEPHSVVLVPVGRGLMQPYERPRSGDLEGTTGSRLPSFPGRGESLRGFTTRGGPAYRLPPDGAAGVELTIPVIPPLTRGKPFTYDSISLQYMGEKWVMAGPSGALPPGLVRIADYKGFPVYAQPGAERDLIYVPFTPARMAPFTRRR